MTLWITDFYFRDVTEMPDTEQNLLKLPYHRQSKLSNTEYRNIVRPLVTLLTPNCTQNRSSDSKNLLTLIIDDYLPNLPSSFIQIPRLLVFQYLL